MLTAVLAWAGVAMSVVPAGAAQGYAGYATATLVHADALQSGDTRVVDAEEAFSGASVASTGLAAGILNEMERQVQPAKSGKNSYARASGVEVGLAQTPESDNQVMLAGKAEAAAPPSSAPVTREIGPVKGAPLVYASLLRGQATARWNPGSCVLGEDIARGLGYAADVQVLDTGTANPDGTLGAPVLALDAPGPERAVAQSRSRMRLVPQIDKEGRVVGSRFGLLAETRETVAAVTLFRGTANQITLEFLGEWVLQAVATGVGGQAWVHYGPGKVTPETPLLRMLDAAGAVTNILTTQQLLTNEGLVLKIPGLAEIAIGEDPRAIGGDDTTPPTTLANGTVAAAAVDVVRVKLLPSPTLHAADVRVGHMEVKAQVPVGGISCNVPVQKVPVPSSVRVGETFVSTITVKNPFACDLVHVKVVDEVAVEEDARFRIESTNPAASSAPSGDGLASATIVWNDIGTIPAGGSKSVKATFRAQGGAGKIIDVATATAKIANCKGGGESVAGVGVSVVGAGINGVSAPSPVSVSKVLGKKVSAGELPATGIVDGVFMLAGFALLRMSWMLGRSVRRAT